MKKSTKSCHFPSGKWQKIFLLMNLKICMLLCCIGTLNAAPIDLYGQQMNVSFENKLLTEVLDQLKTETGYQFFYRKGVISNRQRVTISLTDASLEQVLDKVLAENGYAYEIVDDMIVVVNKGAAQQQALETVITGFVTDEENRPLAGVTVVVERERTRGTVTDAMGAYSLRVPDAANARLVFTCIGRNTQTVSISEYLSDNIFLPIQVTMTAQRTSLDNVVVTGYQTISRERTTGAFSVVDNEDLSRQFNSGIASALEGKVAGMRVSSGTIEIRGRSTFDAETDPLFVIDGFPSEYGLAGVNPDDVESITVLKDAAAASIYGARASNGVVVVVTRRSKQGGVQVRVSADYNVTPLYDEMKRNNYISASDYIDMQYDFVNKNPNFDPAQVADGISKWRGMYKPNATLDLMLQAKEGSITQAEADRLIDGYRSNGIPALDDIQKYLHRPTQSQRYMISVGKATEVSNTMASITHTRNQDQVKTSGGHNFDVNVRNNLKVWKWLDVDINLSIHTGHSENPQSLNTDALTGSTTTGDFSGPYTRIVDDAGNAIPVPWHKSKADYDLYLANQDILHSMDLVLQDQLHLDKTITDNLRARSSVALNFKITDWLRFTSGFAYENSNSEVSTIYNRESYSMREKINFFTAVSGTTITYNIPNGDSRQRSYTNGNNYTFRNQFDFDYATGRHAIVAIAGSETREVNTHSSWERLYGYDAQTLSWVFVNQNTLSQGLSGIFGRQTEQNFHGEGESQSRYVSWYANAAYTFDGKYDLTGSIRWDLSNLFGKNDKYLYKPLWSVGAAWSISRERFMEDIRWVNNLRLRMTYGINGNVSHEASPYLVASYSTNRDTNTPTASIVRPPNASLRWEKTDVYNIGLDFALFDRRIRGAVEYYTKYSSDLLAVQSLEPTYGFTGQVMNVGKMTNKGVELALNGTIIATRDIMWTAGLTFAYNKNRVTKYTKEADSASDLYYGTSSSLSLNATGTALVEGKPYRSIYSYDFVRINEKGDPVVMEWAVTIDENGRETGEWKETSLSAITNVESLIYSGTLTPKYTGGFNTVFNYKGLELAANFIYNTGHVRRLQTEDISPISNRFQGPAILTRDQFSNAWKQAGDENKAGVTPRIAYYYEPSTAVLSRSTHWANSDIRIMNASYLKLRTLSLSYSLDNKLLSKIKMKGMTFRAQANNLFCIKANDEGIDPETNAFINTPSYSFGINISF